MNCSTVEPQKPTCNGYFQFLRESLLLSGKGYVLLKEIQLLRDSTRCKERVMDAEIKGEITSAISIILTRIEGDREPLA